MITDLVAQHQARASKQIDVEKLRDWRVRLLKIIEPMVRYSHDQDVMRNAVIKQNAETARALVEEIEEEMGAFL